MDFWVDELSVMWTWRKNLTGDHVILNKGVEFKQ